MENRLTPDAVRAIVMSFLEHIAEHWDVYIKNLPHLRRTLMMYNEFAYGIRFLPENTNPTQDDVGIEFNPKDPLLDDVPKVFGDKFTEEIGSLIYDAWPLRHRHMWRGYVEPKKIKTTDALELAKIPGAGFALFNGKPMELGPSGTPTLWFRGFTTAKEFPWQKDFLDAVRKHPRVRLGIELMRRKIRNEQKRYDRKIVRRIKINALMNERDRLTRKIARLLSIPD